MKGKWEDRGKKGKKEREKNRKDVWQITYQTSGCKIKTYDNEAS